MGWRQRWSLRAMGRRAAELGAIGPLAVFTVVGPSVGAVVLTATFGSWYGGLEDSVNPAPLFFVCAAILAGLSLIPTHASSLVAGMLFGTAPGSVLAMLSVLAAALLGYRVLAQFSRARATLALASRPRASAVHRALLHHSGRRTIWIIALIRLSPLMPFAATNLLMAASGVRLGPFLAGTLLGIAPRVIVVAAAGSGLAELDLSQGADRRLLILGALATAAALFVAGRLASRTLRDLAAPAR